MIAWLRWLSIAPAVLAAVYIALVRYEERHRCPCALCQGKQQSHDGIPCPICSRKVAE